MQICFSILVMMFLSIHSQALKIQRPSAFNNVLNECFKQDFAGQNVNKISQVYAVLEKKYDLVSTNLVERDVVFYQSKELKKLKYRDEKWALYKIKKDETLEVISTGTRQKSRTIEPVLTQLLLHADIRSDQSSTQEQRLGGRELLLSRQNGQIKSLEFKLKGQAKWLECQQKSKVDTNVDICLCRESK